MRLEQTERLNGIVFGNGNYIIVDPPGQLWFHQNDDDWKTASVAFSLDPGG
jgi:hypothetical protein